MGPFRSALLAVFALTAGLAGPFLMAQTVGSPGGLQFQPQVLSDAEGNPPPGNRPPAARLDPPAGQDYRFSLCEGRPLRPGEVSRPCTRANAKTVKGGNDASYIFRTAFNSPLPTGVSLDPYGILHVAEGTRLDPASIRVCVRQLNVPESCGNVGLNRDPIPEAAPPPDQGAGPRGEGEGIQPNQGVGNGPKAGGGNAAMKLGLALAAAAGGAVIVGKMKGANCGPSPLDDYYLLCPGPQCEATKRRYSEWCACEGGTYDRVQSTCTGVR